MYEFFDPDQSAAYTIIQAKLKGREHHTTTGRRWQGRKLLKIITVAMLKLTLKLCRILVDSMYLDVVGALAC